MAAAAAAILLLGGGYQHLAIRQNETFTRMNAASRRSTARQGVRTPLMAMYRRELREIFQVPVYAMNCLATAVMFPLMAAILFFGGGANSQLALLPEFLRLIPGALFAACATALFALTGSMNVAVFTAVSREGKRHEFYRTLPVKPATQLTAKLVMGLTLNLISSLPVAVLALFALPAFRAETVVGFLCGLLFTTGTSTAALMIDVAHPRFGWKNETEAIKQNGIAAVSMFGIMALITAFGFIYYGLTRLGVTYITALVILCVIIATGDVLLMYRLKGKASRCYILQEVQK